jgi:hypothetical protein
MRRIPLGSFVVVMGWIADVSVGPSARAQAPQEDQAKLLEAARKVLHEPPSPLVPGSPRYGIVPPAPKLYELEDAFLRWPLPPDGQEYGAIDGRHLHDYVDELVAISRRYRDQGHPLYWGRPIGSTADAEAAEWTADKFKAAGLSEVHIQQLPIPDPVWEPVQPWEVIATSGNKTLPLTTAHPPYEAAGAPPEGLDLEAVYVGMGSEAEFAGKDVRGKAVVTYSVPFPGGTRQNAQAERVFERSLTKGARAVLAIYGLPGNFRTQSYPVRIGIPVFALGMDEGYRLRDELFASGEPVRIQIRFQVKWVSGRHTATVWGTLPGTTDETIYVIGHTDGWFDAAGDNAGGMAVMIGLAEYFAKVPQADRRRTMVFMRPSGHHGPNRTMADISSRWQGFFAKTALLVNCEHPSTLLSQLSRQNIRWSNTYSPQFWYAGGTSRPRLNQIAIKAFRDFGVTTYDAPEVLPPPGDGRYFSDWVPVLATSDFYQYFHSDGETAETVPWTGLEATARAYAKIIDEVNELDLADLQPVDPPKGGEAPQPPGVR